MRVLELFAGIGGFSAAFPHLNVVSAIDIDRTARDVYLANFQHPYTIREIASLPIEWLASQGADVWWMSPPCTPFTQRGAQRDLDDPRSMAFKFLVRAVTTLRPRHVCVENVVGFEASAAFTHLSSEWSRVGYHIQVHHHCPSKLGWPNRRPRVYCIASLDGMPGVMSSEVNASAHQFHAMHLSQCVDPTVTQESHPGLWLNEAIATRYLSAMDRVSLTSKSPITACFAASYGKAMVRSGSYLETPTGFRRFTPREVARLLGFSDDFQLPMTLSTERLWHLLGNSLSIPSVRFVFGNLLRSPKPVVADNV